MRDGAESLLAMARLAVRGLRTPKPGAAPRAAPRRRIAVERRGTVPSPERIAAYLRATDGTRIAAFRGPEGRVPPVYCATWETRAALTLLTQVADSLPSFGGVIHLESETIPLRPFHPGDPVRSRVELERAEETPRGVRLQVTSRHWNGADQLCSEGSAVYLVRARGGEGSRREEGAPDRVDASASDIPEPAWEEVACWEVGGGAGRRYALASGDYNPIHLWGWTARVFGYRRPILHGYCIEAMVAHALIERHLRGDPAALRRLRIAFRAPLLLPARVRLLAAEVGGRRVFRAAPDTGGKPFAEGDFTAE